MQTRPCGKAPPFATSPIQHSQPWKSFLIDPPSIAKKCSSHQPSLICTSRSMEAMARISIFKFTFKIFPAPIPKYHLQVRQCFPTITLKQSLVGCDWMKNLVYEKENKIKKLMDITVTVLNC